MNAAIRELREAEATMNKTWEGNLSQQGGDCPVSLTCIIMCINIELTVNLVLAAKIFQARRAKINSIPRGNTTASCHYQS